MADANNLRTKDKGTELQLDPTTGFEGVDLTELETHTGLDSGQCKGLVAALTREYALIQGPPGTGKSYLGVQLVRVLLAVRKQAKLGPIVVCCHTNHALDQFLKHLDDAGVNGIIRIGNRSATPELESKNLRRFKSQASRTSLERRDLEDLNLKEWNSNKQKQETTEDLLKACKSPKDPHLLDYIAKTKPDIHRQLITKGKFSATPASGLSTWLGTKRPSAVTSELPDLEQLGHCAEADIHGLSSADRWALVDHWMKASYQQRVDIAFESVVEWELHRKDVGKIFDTVEQRILSKAYVIGITTSTAARKIDLLKTVSPKVMICEEAAEVLEPDFISTLVPGLEHLIQIGDHKQLRPHISNHKLGFESDTKKKWQFDRSQFERRATGEPGLSPVPFAQLNVQRRMRPEISKLVKRLYPGLQDHSLTMDHPDVAGMRHNLFWLDHDYPEDARSGGRHAMSHHNTWEIKMATALVSHLVRQGEYKAGDIALLTPYMGQLACLSAALSEEYGIFIDSKDKHDEVSLNGQNEGQMVKRLIKKKTLLDGVRLATIDNFQGEEAKVVVVSLVRNNPQNKIGFLKTENRVNVLLSRARDGLYLIGNTKTYRQVPMWADVYDQLSDAALVGTKLELCCPRHPETIALCSEPGHFTISVPDHTVLAATVARSNVMIQNLVALVENLVRFSVRTRAAPISAANNATLVSSVVRGLVFIKVPVRCPAQHRAIDFLVTRDATRYWLVICSDKKATQIDCFGGRPYQEVNLDENPIVVLGCGHFFTGKVLDGLVGLDEVYFQDQDGQFAGLKDISSSFSVNLPFCPECKHPFRPFAAMRYNRLTNRAIIDDICKKFLVETRDSLQKLEKDLRTAEKDLKATRASFSNSAGYWPRGRHSKLEELRESTAMIERQAKQYTRAIKPLSDAVLTAHCLSGERTLSIAQQIDKVQLGEQLVLRLHLFTTKLYEVQLRDYFSATIKFVGSPSYKSLEKWSKSASLPPLEKSLNDCRELIKQAADTGHRRVAIAATLSFAKLERLLYYSKDSGVDQNHEKDSFEAIVAEDHTKSCRELLRAALVLCSKLSDNKKLKKRVKKAIGILEPGRRVLSPHVLASLKSALDGRSSGLGTTSGRWCYCVNGHAFATGSFDVPLDAARCSECEEPVRGTDHQDSEGAIIVEDTEMSNDEAEMEVITSAAAGGLENYIPLVEHGTEAVVAKTNDMSTLDAPTGEAEPSQEPDQPQTAGWCTIQ
ncbi:hypothetical protein ACHAP5_010505 [Fusarium lateritium]